MKRLTGWDAMLLYSETPNVPMHTIKIAVVDASDFEGDFGFELFRDTVRKRLPSLHPLRYQLVDIPYRVHHPMWRENVAIDLDYHVRRARVCPPGGRREMNELVGELATAPLDRSRPLWEFYFVEGMAQNRFAVICKVHHALADGVASANLLAKAMDRPGFEPESYTADPVPSTGDLLRAAGRDHVHELARIPRLIKHTVAGARRVREHSRTRVHEPALVRPSGPTPTFMNHVLSPTRTFATATLALSDVKATKSALGMTINELLLAVTSGAIRELRLRYDKQSDEPVVTSVAAATDVSPERISGNRLSGIFVTLPVDVGDTAERVRLTHVAASTGKAKYELLGPDLFGRWAALLPPPLAPFAFRKMATSSAQNRLFNFPISNVPGPRQRVSMAGAPMSEFYSVGPLMAGCGINITVWSYVDQLNISVLADDITIDDPHEVTDAMVRAFIDIRLATGLSNALTVVDTAMGPAAAGPG